ncbi:MAG: zinc dependent phospholipase C family protein [Actinobacteria bacterium]|nr:zinc dependent phospholipase C family protein [Actinomycetota bacterium]
MRLKRNFLFFVVLISFWFAFQSTVYGWGPLTHPLINKIALEKSKSIPYALDIDVLPIYTNAGNAPDIIAFNTVKSLLSPSGKDLRFEYAHNMFPQKFGGDPVFGLYMAKIAKDNVGKRFNQFDLAKAYGWIGHQLADGITHPEKTGYSETKKTFVIGKTINHAAAEFGVDVILANRYPEETSKINLAVRPALVHEASIKFYNEDKFKDKDLPRDYPPQKLLNCPTTKNFAKEWALGIETNKLLIKQLIKNKPVIVAGITLWYSDFDKDDPETGNAFNRSVNEVKNYLENPDKFNLSYQKNESIFAWLKQKIKDIYLNIVSIFKNNSSLAEEEDPNIPGESLYYSFISKLTQEAINSGAIEITETNENSEIVYRATIKDENLFEKAIENVVNQDLNSDDLDIKIWARYMEGLFLSNYSSFDDIKNRAADFSPPVITSIQPKENSIINNLKPDIVINYKDEESRIDVSKVKLYLDNQDITSKSVITEESASFVPDINLAGGVHQVKIELADIANNQLVKEFKFEIKIPTNIKVNQTKVLYSDSVNLTAELIDIANNKLINKNIEFYLDLNKDNLFSLDELISTGSTDNNGQAFVSYQATIFPDTYKYLAKFKEDYPYLPSENTADLLIDFTNTAGRVWGSGSIVNNKINNFFQVNIINQSGTTKPFGIFTHKTPLMNLFSNNIAGLIIWSDKKKAVVKGVLNISGANYIFLAKFEDNSTTGVSDVYEIKIFRLDKTIYYQAKGVLSSGNIFIYR